MRARSHFLSGTGAMLAMLGIAVYSQSASKGPPGSLSPKQMPRTGTVDERFQSFNVEMVEVTGGRFWKPYNSTSKSPAPGKAPASTPAGMDPNLYEYRSPIDLSNPRLRKLAAALGPTYVRVSGTWANTTYFQDSDASAPPTAPAGFNSVLTRAEWKGVVDFTHAVNGKIMSSFATSPGTRGLDGIWTPEQARKLLAYTKSVGGSIAAAEFMNEPTFAAIGGAPKGYDASTYGRDVAVFSRFIKEAAPEMVFLGPGSVGEGASLGVSSMPSMLKSEDLLKATGPVYDVFSYHLYAGVSKRCAGAKAASPESALSEDWLSRSDKITTYYADLRDRFEPGKPLWLTETADAACGGNPWASTFLDTFRYLDQHGRLAQRSVQIIAHNTLASSDYGLLDETTLNPRPNYWAALLWQKLMGTTVLNPGASSSPSVHLYAQCLRAHPGGVALLALNIDQQAAHEISLPIQAERYTLTAKEPQDTSVQLNGKTLEAGRDGSVPALSSVQAQAGRVKLEPTSVTFLAIPEAGNSSCQ